MGMLSDNSPLLRLMVSISENDGRASSSKINERSPRCCPCAVSRVVASGVALAWFSCSVIAHAETAPPSDLDALPRSDLESALPSDTESPPSDLESALPAGLFFRARREALVNVTKIKEIKPYFRSGFLLVMADTASTEIVVSERQVRPLRERFPGL